MSFEKFFSKKCFSSVRSETEAHLRTAKKLLYSVRKFVVAVVNSRSGSNSVEDGRYSGRPVKQPHGFPSAGITLRFENQ